MSETNLTDYLVANPRMIGVLFTILLLLSQAGNSMAAAAGGYSGP